MTSTLYDIAYTNALCAALLSAVIGVVCLAMRSPQIRHALWLLVLVKLVTPPLWSVRLDPWLRSDRAVPTGRALASWSHSDSQTRHQGSLARGVGEFAQPVHGYPYVDASLGLAVSAAVTREVPGTDQPLPTAAEVDQALEDGQHASRTSRPAMPVGAGLPIAQSGQVADDPAPSAAGIYDMMERVRPHLDRLLLIGSCVLLGATAWRLMRFRALVGQGMAAPRWLDALGRQLACELGVRGHIEIQLVPAAVAPAVWCPGLRPRIVLPQTLVQRLTRDELAAVVGHELAHIRRGDHWIRWLELAVIICHWWNPVAWWVRSRLRHAEEQCCDARVVQAFPQRARDYCRATGPPGKSRRGTRRGGARANQGNRGNEGPTREETG